MENHIICKNMDAKYISCCETIKDKFENLITWADDFVKFANDAKRDQMMGKINTNLIINTPDIRKCRLRLAPPSIKDDQTCRKLFQGDDDFVDGPAERFNSHSIPTGSNSNNRVNRLKKKKTESMVQWNLPIEDEIRRNRMSSRLNDREDADHMTHNDDLPEEDQSNQTIATDLRSSFEGIYEKPTRKSKRHIEKSEVFKKSDVKTKVLRPSKRIKKEMLLTNEDAVEREDVQMVKPVRQSKRLLKQEPIVMERIVLDEEIDDDSVPQYKMLMNHASPIQIKQDEEPTNDLDSSETEEEVDIDIPSTKSLRQSKKNLKESQQNEDVDVIPSIKSVRQSKRILESKDIVQDEDSKTNLELNEIEQEEVDVDVPNKKPSRKSKRNIKEMEQNEDVDVDIPSKKSVRQSKRNVKEIDQNEDEDVEVIPSIKSVRQSKRILESKDIEQEEDDIDSDANCTETEENKESDSTIELSAMTKKRPSTNNNNNNTNTPERPPRAKKMKSFSKPLNSIQPDEQSDEFLSAEWESPILPKCKVLTKKMKKKTSKNSNENSDREPTKRNSLKEKKKSRDSMKEKKNSRDNSPDSSEDEPMPILKATTKSTRSTFTPEQSMILSTDDTEIDDNMTPTAATMNKKKTRTSSLRKQTVSRDVQSIDITPVKPVRKCYQDTEEYSSDDSDESMVEVRSDSPFNKHRSITGFRTLSVKEKAKAMQDVLNGGSPKILIQRSKVATSVRRSHRRSIINRKSIVKPNGPISKRLDAIIQAKIEPPCRTPLSKITPIVQKKKALSTIRTRSKMTYSSTSKQTTPRHMSNAELRSIELLKFKEQQNDDRVRNLQMKRLQIADEHRKIREVKAKEVASRREIQNTNKSVKRVMSVKKKEVNMNIESRAAMLQERSRIDRENRQKRIDEIEVKRKMEYEQRLIKNIEIENEKKKHEEMKRLKFEKIDKERQKRVELSMMESRIREQKNLEEYNKRAEESRIADEKLAKDIEENRIKKIKERERLMNDKKGNMKCKETNRKIDLFDGDKSFVIDNEINTIKNLTGQLQDRSFDKENQSNTPNYPIKSIFSKLESSNIFSTPIEKKSHDNYNIDNLNEDSTDDECNPKNKIPLWADFIRVKKQVRMHAQERPCLYEMIPEILMPDINEIFGSQKKFKPRTSSAVWTSPRLLHH